MLYLSEIQQDIYLTYHLVRNLADKERVCRFTIIFYCYLAFNCACLYFMSVIVLFPGHTHLAIWKIIELVKDILV